MKRLAAAFLCLSPLWSLAQTAPAPTNACEPNEKVLFSCQIKGEPIAYCGGDNKKGLQWLRFKQTTSSGIIEVKTDNQVTDLKNKVLFVAEDNQQRASFTTVHFDHKGLTYALTKCEGMNCVAVMDYPWFAVYSGKKRISSNFCDKGTQSPYNFEFKRTKQGQLNGDSLLSIKKGMTRFDDLPSGSIPD
ncbi:hypothetical protein MCERE10_03821 [Burkholderiaceae bacterium]